MNGCIISGTPIAVDFWKVRKCPQAKLFFLSHMHADHTAGLTPSWNQKIYCTPLTGKLLHHKFQIQRSLIQELEVNESHIIPIDNDGMETVTVSVIDAHHCPGSAMFVFQGYFGTVFYTGDFRFSHAMFVNTPLVSLGPVDILYLDNTYCDEQCEFPTRIQAQAKIIRIIEDNPDHQVLIGMRTLGKEDLLESIAHHFNTWIVVTPKYYSKLKLLGNHNVFVTNPNEGYIHVVPFHQMTRKLISQWTERHGIPTIGILPTALYYIKDEDYHSCSRKDGIYVVPYSDHSSYSELQMFVSRINPKCIIPVVQDKFRSGASGRADMSCFSSYINPDPRTLFEVPMCVQTVMSKTLYNKRKIKRNSAFVSIKERYKYRKLNKHPKGIVFSTPVKSMEGRDENITVRLTADINFNASPNKKCKLANGLETREDFILSDDMNKMETDEISGFSEDSNDACYSNQACGNTKCIESNPFKDNYNIGKAADKLHFIYNRQLCPSIIRIDNCSPSTKQKKYEHLETYLNLWKMKINRVK